MRSAPLWRFLKPFLYSLVIVRIGAGRLVGEHLRLCYITDKQLVASKVGGRGHLKRHKRVCVFRNILHSVFCADVDLAVFEFIHVSARLHTEVSDYLKRYALREHRHVENSRLLDQLSREVFLLAGEGDFRRLRCDLEHRVADTAVILVAVFRRHNEKSVGQLEQRGGVYLRFLVISESNERAGPQTPCRDELRREPFRELYRG